MLPEGKIVEVDLVLVDPAEIGTPDIFGTLSYPVAQIGTTTRRLAGTGFRHDESNLLIKSTNNGLTLSDVNIDTIAGNVRDASYDEFVTSGVSELYLLDTFGVGAYPVNSNGRRPASPVNRSLTIPKTVTDTWTHIAVSNRDLYGLNANVTPLVAQCYNATSSARQSTKDYTITEPSTWPAAIGGEQRVFQFEISNGWEFIIRNSNSAYARKLDTTAIPFTYETGMGSTHDFTGLTLRRTQIRGQSGTNGILANMHVSGLGNTYADDVIILYYLGGTEVLTLIDEDGTVIDTVDFSAQPSRPTPVIEYVSYVLTSIDTALTRSTTIDTPVFNTVKVPLARVALRFAGEAITYDINNNIRGQVRAERTMFAEVQGDLPDVVLEHTGKINFRYQNQLFEAIGWDQTEDELIVMQFSYRPI